MRLIAVATQRPDRRLDRAEIAAHWGGADRGLLAVCGPDEDALSLAVAAATQIEDAALADTVVFASPRSPLPGASGAATAVMALGLPPQTTALDVTGGRRCGLQALALARDLVRAQPERRVLVLVGDDRRVPHATPEERGLGHAGFAALVGSQPGVAEIVAHGAVGDPGPDRWTDASGAERTAGERFLAQAAFPALLAAAAGVTEVDKRLSDVVGVHVAAAAPGQAAALAGGVHLDAATADPTAWALGDAGAAMPGLLLTSALAGAAAGELHALVGLGGGADVLLVERQDAPVAPTAAPRATARPYGLHLRHAGRLVDGPRVPDTSPVSAWRDRAAVVGLVGAVCEQCDQRSYPVRPSCPACGHAGPGTPRRMVGTGRVVTSTTDHVVAGVNPGTPESPTTMVVVDLDAGGRVFLPAVHGPAPAIGQRVDTVLRVAHDGGGVRHHHWRVAPLDHEDRT